MRVVSLLVTCVISFGTACGSTLAIDPPLADTPASLAQFPNRLAKSFFNKADSIFEAANAVQYEHLHAPATEQVRFTGGGCAVETDCSGFVSNVLHSVSAKHYLIIREMQPKHGYPQAKIYAKFFSELPKDQALDGWLRVGAIKELAPGDIIAWEKGGTNDDHGGGGNSGHVMIVIDPPSEIFQVLVDGAPIRYVNVRVLDSSSVKHFPPEELPPNAGQASRDGLGKGVIRLVLNDRDQPIGYWEGTYWGEGSKSINGPSYSDAIFFGRLIPYSESG
jgi:hypothetical protein